MSGWIKLHRKFLEWGWYSDHIAKDVFLHLLLTANYKDSEWKGLLIKRGQVVISTAGDSSLTKMLGFSRQQTRTALNKLKSTNEITTKSTNKFTVVTIVKYEEYQSGDEEATNEITTKSTNEQPTSNQQVTTSKESKKKKEIKKSKNLEVDFFYKKDLKDDFDIRNYLVPELELYAQETARIANMDYYALIKLFNDLVKNNPPKYPNKAFKAWLDSYAGKIIKKRYGR